MAGLLELFFMSDMLFLLTVLIICSAVSSSGQFAGVVNHTQCVHSEYEYQPALSSIATPRNIKVKNGSCST